MYATYEQMCIARADQYAKLCELQAVVLNNGHDPQAIADVLSQIIQILIDKHMEG